MVGLVCYLCFFALTTPMITISSLVDCQSQPAETEMPHFPCFYAPFVAINTSATFSLSEIISFFFQFSDLNLISLLTAIRGWKKF